MKITSLSAALTVAAGLSIASAGPSLVAETLWDTGTLEGWTYSGGGPSIGDWVNPGVGGNPGGYVQYIDGTDGAAPPPFLFAPNEFLGNYTAYIGGFFQYDIRLDPAAGDGSDTTNYPRVRLLGADGSIARADLEFLLTNDWQQVTVGITEANWEMVQGTWDGLIQNVSGLQFGGDHTIGSGPESGVDNFRLFIPSPGAAVTILVAGALTSRRRR